MYRPSCGDLAEEAFLASQENKQAPVIPDASEIDFDAQFDAFEEEVVVEAPKTEVLHSDRDASILGRESVTDGESSEDAGSKLMIPIVVIAIVVVLIIIISVVCCKLSKRKRMVVEDSEKSIQNRLE